MRLRTPLLLIPAIAGAIATLSAQATGTPSFNAPYRAFTRSEFGVVISFPDPGGTAFEGVFRQASGKFDIGFKGGLWDPCGPCKTIFLAGVEARERVITHTEDFPLDGALVLGVGGEFVSGNSALVVPVGLSLGRRVDPQGSQISIVPYVQPTMFVTVDGGTNVNFTLGLGADFRLSRVFDARISAGLGDLKGVSLSAVWVH